MGLGRRGLLLAAALIMFAAVPARPAFADSPVAQDGTATVAEDASVPITLQASDADGDTLTYSVVDQPTHGAVTCDSGGSCTYTPAANYNGADSFTFTANDGTTDSNTATVSITVTPVNHAPVSSDGTLTVAEDGSAPVSLGALDPDGDPLTYSVVAAPAHGQVTCAPPQSGSCTYSPDANYNGADSFTFKANDGTLDSNISTVSVTITPVNDPPVASNDTLNTSEGNSAPITLTATDVDGDSLTYAIVSQPPHGAVSCDAGGSPNCTYAPDALYSGPDSFTFRANDGTVNSNTATINVTVSAVNHAPLATNGTVTVAEDGSAPVTLQASDIDGDTLTYSIVGQPAHGNATCDSAGSCTYSPDANYNGADSFTFRANDGSLDSNTATVSVTVTPVNDPPVATSGSMTVPEDGSGNVTLHATDIDSPTLSYFIVSQPAHGNVVCNPSGAPSCTYSATELNYNGPDSFTFRANDGTANSNTATISVTVTPVNDAPVASNDTLATSEGNSAPITLTATDVDGDTLTYSIVGQPAHGSVNCAAGGSPNCTYTPDANYSGPDTFTFRANDGTVNSNTATISVTVSAVNHAPVATNGTMSAPEDGTGGVTLTASDPDGDTLTYSIVAQPSHGTAACGAGGSPNCTYTATDTDYNGSDSFTFRANDGQLNSNTATISVTVTAVNDAPVATNGTLTVSEDSSSPVTLHATDVDSPTLTYAIVAQPSHGTVTCGAGGSPSCTYTATDANYNGPDSFTFRANDGQLNSNTATVSVTVTPVNDAPVASNGTVTVAEGNSASITLTATDVDGDTLTYSIVGQPGHGTVNCAAGGSPNCTYTPDANYSGPDSFTFRANDGTVNSNTATISVTVSAVNHAPVATNGTMSAPEDGTAGVTLPASDPDGDTLTYSIVAQPTHGHVTCSPTGAATCTYSTTEANYNGPDSFTFRANDGSLDSNTATMSVTVTPVNDPPVATNGTLTVAEDSNAPVTLHATDVDNATLTYAIVTQPSHGTVTCGAGGSPSCTYTATDANYNGPDSFTFRANDGTANSNTATVDVTVTPVNDAPVASNGTLTVAEGNSASITLTATDVDGDTLSYAIVGQPGHGTVTCGAGGSPNCTYTVTDANYNGPDSFTFKANDGKLDSNTATVSLTITPVNDAPVATNGTMSVPEDGSGGVTLHATDVDSPTLSYAIVAQPAHGTVNCSPTGAPTCTYTATDANYNGPDSFTFRANDGQLNSNTATISVTVTPVNDAPVATDATLGVAEDGTAPVTLHATDVDGDTLTYAIVGQPAHGTVSCDAGGSPNCTYSPNTSYSGPDSFTFRANDGAANSNTATISVTVSAVNHAPVASNGTLSVAEGGNAPITLPASDPDSDPLTYSIVTQPTHGNLSCNPTGAATCTYTTTDANYNGADSFTFRANDGQLNSNTATINVTVTPVNDPPVATNGTLTAAEDSSAPVTLQASDIDSPSLTYVIVAQPAHGTVTCSPTDAPTCTYTATDANYNGGDSFTFRANDGQLNSNTATVNVTVTAVNDAPVASNDTMTVAEGGSASITLTATDVDSASLTYAILGQPGHGTVSCSPAGSPNCTYTATDANYDGPDPFTFRASDGQLNSNVGTITVTVTPVNDAPVATNGTLTVAEDSTGSVTLHATDVDSPSLSYVIVGQPAHGSVICNPAGSSTCTYSATDANYSGPDVFTFRANDGQADSNVATVSVTITPVNDAPVATNGTLTVAEDSSAPVTLQATDVDSSTLTYAIVTPPAHGQVDCIPDGSPNCTYIATDPNYNGPDSFTFRANDGQADSNTATINVTVAPVNDPPVASDGTLTLAEDTSASVTLHATDLDSAALTYSIVGTPAHGQVTCTPNGSPTCTYTANDLNYNGPDSFTFRANDGTTASNLATVTVTITPVNDPPVATNRTVSVPEDSSSAVTLSATDPESDALTYSIVTPPAHGAVSCSPTGSPNCTYTATDLNYNGPDTFTYKANDGLADSNVATVSVTVTPVNDPPVATNSSVSVPEDGSAPVTLNAINVDGDILNFSIVKQPLHGAVTCSPTGSPNCTYTATDLNFNGPDSFTFKANDGQLDSNIATVSITITPVNDAPVAVNGAISVGTDGAELFTLAASDVDADPLTYTIVTQPLHGSVTCAPAGSPNCTFTTTDSHFVGNDQFTFRANDGQVNSNVATVTVAVASINQPPVVTNRTLSVPEDGSAPITLTGTDHENDSLTFSVISAPTHGAVVCNSAAVCTFTANDPNYNGPDSFTYRANDGQADSNIATVSVTITPVDDAPVATDGTLTVAEDDSAAVTLHASDIDSASLTYSIVTQPLHGTVTCIPAKGPVCTYTATDLNYNGSDSFTFKANDGSLDSNTATVSVTITPVDDAPVANPDSVTTNEDQSISITRASMLANDTDVDSPPPTFNAIVVQPTNGTLTVITSGYTYTPNPDFNGTDSFVYRISDGSLTADGVVTIHVTPVNDAPVAEPDGPLSLGANQSLIVTAPGVLVNDTDVDGDHLTGALVLQPSHGLVVFHTDGSFTYTPSRNYLGNDSFSYQAVDPSNAHSASATVSLTVTLGVFVGTPGPDDQGFVGSQPQGLTVDLMGGNDIYRVFFGKLTGPVTIKDSGNDSGDQLIASGTTGNDTISVAGNQVTSGSQRIQYSGVESLNVVAGIGNDTVNVDAHSLGSLRTIDGGAGIDTLSINASGLSARISGNTLFLNGRAVLTWTGFERISLTSAIGAQKIDGTGYWVFASNGGVFAFGDARSYGSVASLRLRSPIIQMIPTPSGRGYWMLARDGGVFSFGDAHFYGSTGGLRLRAPIIQMIRTPSGRGYWLLASDGGVFSFGDAHFYGSTGGLRLRSPIVQMVATATGKGYWLHAADGGIFAFGDARFYGSAAGVSRTRPVVALVRTPAGDGYWVLEADGRVSAFGSVAHLPRPSRALPSGVTAVGLVSTPTGRGYWTVATDGSVSAFGDAPFFGSMYGKRLSAPVVGMVATPTGRGYWLIARDGGIFSFGDAAYYGSARTTVRGLFTPGV